MVCRKSHMKTSREIKPGSTAEGSVQAILQWKVHSFD